MVTIDNHLLQTRIAEEKIVAIIRTVDADSAVNAAKTLFDSGISILEISLTVKDAALAIERVASLAPDGCLVGAGTVVSSSQVDECVQAGAQFIVTPTLSESVKYALSKNIGVLAGAYSPTEIQTAMNLGVAAVKLFPANSLGPSYVRALLEPFPSFRIIPVGGVGVSNIQEFLTAGALAVGVGGSLIGDSKDRGGNQASLRERAKQFLAEVRSK
jgi:2-dehydro-3-deoxyphosphogluconate aldolase/(4S)-4-hydroxy-2-oxoglutarate aldolase